MILKDINARLKKIEPKNRIADGISRNYSAAEVRSTGLNPKKSSPKAKSSTREVSLFGDGALYDSSAFTEVMFHMPYLIVYT